MTSYEIFRDAYGIPHVRAGSVPDLAHGQGVATARDRAWQLDLERLRGEGRVASLLGEPGVEWDVFARRARIAETAQRSFALLDAETQEFVSAYVDGVNAGLGSSNASVEHAALDATPGRWEPWAPLSVFLVQQILFATYPSKLWRQHLVDTIGPEALGWFRQEGMPLSGSNAFAVAGGRTRSGKPLVAGDPHRLFEAPNVYAQVRLACPEFDVVGFTFPGVPGVQHFGHTGSVAWAITNAMADYQDLFVEEDLTHAETHLEEIEVRDGDPVEVDVTITPRGPIVVDHFSLRTASYVCEDLGFGAILPLLRARTTADVDAAMAHWVEPVNNVVIADDQGTVLHRVAGKVPVRPLENRTLPAPVGNEWTGWVTDLPRTTVADDGFVVTANQRLSPDYVRIGDDFARTDRADRITELLGERTDLAVDDLAGILTDTWSRKAGGRMEDVGEEYVAHRDALVAEVAARPEIARLDGAAPYGELYDPWFFLPLRIAKALPTASVVSTDGSQARLLDQRGAVSWPKLFHPLHGLEQLGVEHPLVDALHKSTAVPVYGDNDCVQAMHSIPGSPVCSRGPVARYVWDLADRSNSHWVVPLGASGVPGPHHHDQLDLWANGRLAPVVTDWDRLEKEEP